MILNDSDIREMIRAGDLLVVPDEDREAVIAHVLDTQVQPASLDVRLDSHFMAWVPSPGSLIDPRVPLPDSAMHEFNAAQVVIPPGGFVLASTVEHVKIPPDIVARVEGRSSIGRLGIAVHVTAGFIDPGFSGRITLEIANLNPNPVVLVAGMRIAQLAFHRMTSEAAAPYRGKYQGQTRTTASRSHHDFTPDVAKHDDTAAEDLRMRIRFERDPKLRAFGERLYAAMNRELTAQFIGRMRTPRVLEEMAACATAIIVRECEAAGYSTEVRNFLLRTVTAASA